MNQLILSFGTYFIKISSDNQQDVHYVPNVAYIKNLKVEEHKLVNFSHSDSLSNYKNDSDRIRIESLSNNAIFKSSVLDENIHYPTKYTISDGSLLHAYQAVHPFKFGGRLNEKISLTLLSRIIQEILLISLKKYFGFDTTNLSSINVIYLFDTNARRFDINFMHCLLFSLGFNCILTIPQCLSISYSLGQQTCCIVDIGLTRVSISCISDGYLIPKSQITLKTGVLNVASILLNYLCNLSAELDQKVKKLNLQTKNTLLLCLNESLQESFNSETKESINLSKIPISFDDFQMNNIIITNATITKVIDHAFSLQKEIMTNNHSDFYLSDDIGDEHLIQTFIKEKRNKKNPQNLTDLNITNNEEYNEKLVKKEEQKIKEESQPEDTNQGNLADAIYMSIFKHVFKINLQMSEESKGLKTNDNNIFTITSNEEMTKVLLETIYINGPNLSKGFKNTLRSSLSRNLAKLVERSTRKWITPAPEGLKIKTFKNNSNDLEIYGARIVLGIDQLVRDYAVYKEEYLSKGSRIIREKAIYNW